MNFKKLIAILLATVTCVATFTACNLFNGETTDSESDSENGSSENGDQTVERFDYFNSDMTQYISINASDYKNTSVTLDKMYEVSNEGMTAYIDMLCKEYSVLSDEKITDRAVVEGDTVMLYYEGYKDGVAFNGGSNMDDDSPHPLEIGSGNFIPGFEEALIGIIPSETSRDNLVDLDLKFPDDYHNAEMAGQSVVFKVYIEYIAEYVPAEYNEDFITNTLKYTTTDEDVKASFEKYLLEELLPSLRDTEILNTIWNELFEKAVVKSYPQSELDYYYNSYVEQYEYYKSYYEQFGMTFEDLDDFVEQYLGLDAGADWKKTTREQSEIDVMQNLIFHGIAQQEGINITQTDYQNSLNYYVEYYKNNGYNYTAAQVESEVGSRLIKEYALFDKIQALMLENCTVTYKDSEDVTEDNTEDTEDTEDTLETESESVESESESSENAEQ